MRSTKAVTLKDVAEKAGVSQAVVSTVLNDRANNGIFASETTRQRVVEAAHQLGYVTRTRPLPPVRRLNAPVTMGHPVDNRLVALLLGRRFAGNMFTDIFYGVNSVLSPQGYHPIVLDTYAETYTNAAAKEADALEYARKNQMAGVILWHEGGPANVEMIAEIHENRCPVVAIDRRVPDLDLDYVGTDNFHGAYQAVSHLIEAGHRRIAHLTSLGMTDAASERLNGYQQALRDAGIETNPRHILLAVDGGRRIDRAAFRDMFAGPSAPTAMFLLSDYWAPAVHGELCNMGLRIPDDVALVGFDDVVQPGLEGVELTSMAQDFEGIGKAAADVIMQRITHPEGPSRTVVFPAHLVVRRSSVPNWVTVSQAAALDDAAARISPQSRTRPVVVF
ncbi:MAG: LacI family DNA-binding transcriptional regulator [Capsulimonadaceae bacterium]|nr:LacI family DNA-binding transcriptional regulator [Capsulimonadaceae bacterium]